MKQPAGAPPDPGPPPDIRFTKAEADMLCRAIINECDRRIDAALDWNGDGPRISASLMLEICDRVLITRFGWRQPAAGDMTVPGTMIAKFNAAVRKEIRAACLEDRNTAPRAPGNRAGKLRQKRKRPCPE